MGGMARTLQGLTGNLIFLFFLVGQKTRPFFSVIRVVLLYRRVMEMEAMNMNVMNEWKEYKKK